MSKVPQKIRGALFKGDEDQKAHAAAKPGNCREYENFNNYKKGSFFRHVQGIEEHTSNRSRIQQKRGDGNKVSVPGKGIGK